MTTAELAKEAQRGVDAATVTDQTVLPVRLRAKLEQESVAPRRDEVQIYASGLVDYTPASTLSKQQPYNSQL